MENENDRRKRLLLEKMRKAKNEIQDLHSSNKYIEKQSNIENIELNKQNDEMVSEEEKINTFISNLVTSDDVDKLTPEEIEDLAKDAVELRQKSKEIKESSIIEEIDELPLEAQMAKLNLNEEEKAAFTLAYKDRERRRYIASLNLKKLKKIDHSDTFDYSYDETQEFIPLKYDTEPQRMIGQDLEKFMIWAVAQKTSDVFIQSDEPIICDIFGNKHFVTKQKISNPQVTQMISYIYKSEAALSTLNGGHDVDCQWSVPIGKGKFLRFRVNITAHQSYGTKGYEITIRTINGRAPLLETLNLPPRLVKALSPKQGLIMVAGATGSGKSTLLASILDWRLRDPNAHIKVLTYEKPIEFVYDDVPRKTSLISQVEVGVHLPSFEDGIVNALRRKPDVILVGEMRDKETIGEGITASMTGHLVYGTVHATTVANTILRMVNAFGAEEKDARSSDILGSIQMVIAQKLLKTVDGKRVAVREYLLFDKYVKDVLQNTPLSNLIYETQKLVETRGQSFLDDITEKYLEGVISQRVYDEELFNLGFKEM